MMFQIIPKKQANVKTQTNDINKLKLFTYSNNVPNKNI